MKSTTRQNYLYKSTNNLCYVAFLCPVIVYVCVL